MEASFGIMFEGMILGIKEASTGRFYCVVNGIRLIRRNRLSRFRSNYCFSCVQRNGGVALYTCILRMNNLVKSDVFALLNVELRGINILFVSFILCAFFRAA